MKVGIHTTLKPGAEERYEEYHRAVWPDVLAAIRRAGITEYVILRVGRALRDKRRAEFSLGTKVGRLLRPDAPPERGQVFFGTPPVNPVFDFSYDGAMRSFEESRQRLGIERVDILHIHDPDDHFEEALSGAYRALDRLRRDGVIRAVGSGMNQAAMLTAFARRADFDCFLVAGRYTLLDHAGLEELLPLCA